MENKKEQELFSLIAKKAASYTPEWRFDREHPDAGTAIAEIFAKLHQGTRELYGRLPEKFGTEFFNLLHTSMRAASPASGYVSFGLAGDTIEGTELPAGTVLTAEEQLPDGSRIPLETKEDVYVSPVRFASVYESADERDFIGRLYAEDGEMQTVRLFGFEEENLQRHIFYIGHSAVFAVRGGAKIELSFSAGGNGGAAPADARFLAALCDPVQAEIAYSDGENYVPFQAVYAENGRLCLIKGAAQPAWESSEIAGISARWLRIRLWDSAVLRDFSFRSLTASSTADLLPPEAVVGAGGELPRQEYYPFGEQFGLYDEVYFASDEALSKAGAVVQLSFSREFVKVPLSLVPGQQTDWKLIMRRQQFQVEREYDITIGEVIWEYYNGAGWARLFPGRDYGDIFGIETGLYRKKVQITFTCPADAAPVLVGSCEARCIRARILKVNNAYKTQGQYIAPVLSETCFQYQYRQPVVPAFLAAENNLELESGNASGFLMQTRPFCPFRLAGDRTAALYFGTAQNWERGPLRILFEMQETGRTAPLPPLIWEYYGRGSWRELKMADGTEHFARTGLLTFAEPEEAERLRLFGEERFWLRAREPEGAKSRLPEECPVLRRWHYNSTRAWTVRSGFRELFTIERYEPELLLRLPQRGIYRLEVWVDETDSLFRKEAEKLRAEGRLREFRDEDGRVRRQFVRWKERDSLQESGRTDRHYTLDANEGVLRFGDGNRGRQPAQFVPDGIEVRYSIGCGSAGNLAAGTINGLDLSLGYINQVGNPLPFAGGSDRESAREAMRRRSGELRHRFRAVTASDYEKLALEASGAVERAACLAGFDEQGQRAPGHVTLLLLQKRFETEGHSFPELRAQIRSYFSDKLPAGLPKEQFHIVPPEFVEIMVSAELWVDSYDDMFACRREAEEQLRAFLHPVTGGFTGKGWRAGQLPARGQIETLLRNIRLIRDLRNLTVSGKLRRGGNDAEVSLEELSGRPFLLPVCGAHRIRIASVR